ncbi:hypothetical protein NG796_21975 [Laspinema sp. A4]|uniref:hypothetical protein n=1 Tax=Laspinema sp. D2d TaxID=2953686 RepID=UPI0021BB2A90|nr:hypothetical protein [Laspinema sp. D2d]MCT7985950.1 hypothetical protein [Laspinema sp. D2d]
MLQPNINPELEGKVLKELETLWRTISTMNTQIKNHGNSIENHGNSIENLQMEMTYQLRHLVDENINLHANLSYYCPPEDDL